MYVITSTVFRKFLEVFVRFMFQSRQSSSRMVHQNALVISEETRQDLEDGGGTKSKTRAVRATFGLNFVAYCESREEAWCTAPLPSPAWWVQKEGELGGPRTMAELCHEVNSELLGRYLKNWLWEMQVCTV